MRSWNLSVDFFLVLLLNPQLPHSTTLSPCSLMCGHLDNNTTSRTLALSTAHTACVTFSRLSQNLLMQCGQSVNHPRKQTNKFKLAQKNLNPWYGKPLCNSMKRGPLSPSPHWVLSLCNSMIPTQNDSWSNWKHKNSCKAIAR
jgi:hypothetical protein